MAKRRLTAGDIAAKTVVVNELKGMLRGKEFQYQTQERDARGFNVPITRTAKVSIGGPTFDVPPLVDTGVKDDYGNPRVCNLCVFFEDILGWDLLDPSDEKEVMDMVRSGQVLACKELTGMDQLIGEER